MSKNNNDFFVTKKDWSEIKDNLLAYYLKPYFQKVIRTNRPIFYVDCFAGKGKFDDGKDGSPRIALNIRDVVVHNSKALNPRIDACFIDLNYADELQDNVAGFDCVYGRSTVVSGKYEEKIESILAHKKDHNIFLYVDPYGIKALDHNLFAKFADYQFASIEILINMNSFGFVRAACRALSVDFELDGIFEDLVEYEPTKFDSSRKSIELLNQIAGGDYWQEIIQKKRDEKISGYEAEKLFSEAYKKKLKEKYTYVLDMPICIKSSQHPKYRMIHVTNHEDGCILMADNMFDRNGELFVEVQHSGQLSLFPVDVHNNFVDHVIIEDKLLHLINSLEGSIRVNKLIATFFRDHGVLCKLADVRTVLSELEKKNKIQVIRFPALTDTSKPTSFFTEKSQGKQTVTIRRQI